MKIDFTTPVSFPRWMLGLLVVGVGVIATWAGFIWGYPQNLGPVEMREFNSEYKFINPLLNCELAEGRLDTELPSAKQPVLSVINKAKAQGAITEAAVYYRQLNNGWWFGINEREKFQPASLLKVPVMMAIYKEAQTSPELLQRKVSFSEPDPTAEQFNTLIPPAEKLTPGSYSIEELVDRMIKYSDNQATSLLADQLSLSQLQETYTDLHLEDPLSDSSDGSVNVKEYAGFLRVLFNSSYLDRKYSEMALTKLNETVYRDGLVAGVPSDVAVAHKFGESRGPNGEKQLHDCGIIYAGTTPYLLCVMTRGDDYTELQDTIAEISREVYRTVIRGQK